MVRPDALAWRHPLLPEVRTLITLKDQVCQERLCQLTALRLWNRLQVWQVCELIGYLNEACELHARRLNASLAQYRHRRAGHGVADAQRVPIMKSTFAGLACAVTLGVAGFAVFSGCGGNGQAGGSSAAGANSAGTGGGSAGTGSVQGGNASSGAGASNSAGESNAVECSPGECGPQLGLPNWVCEDGTTGGPTGRCVKAGDACAWEVRDCPPGGEGGAGSQGGQGNAAGAPGGGGASSDPCGGCDAPQQICVYQLGGPGPSRFTCATQNPCGAAGACACIVEQGTCENMLMGDPPNYCVCDNGLD